MNATAADSLTLSAHERALLDGEAGEAMRFAMRLVVRAARILRALATEDFARLEAGAPTRVDEAD